MSDTNTPGASQPAPSASPAATPPGASSAGDRGQGQAQAGNAGTEQADLLKLGEQIRNLERQRDQANSERDRAKNELEQLHQRAMATPPPDTRQQDGLDKLDKLEELVEQEGVTAVKGVLKALRDMTVQSKAENADAVRRLEAKLQDIIEQSDPAYQAKKETVDKLVEATGLARGQVLKLLSVLPSAPSQPPRAAAPASTPGSSTAGAEQEPTLDPEVERMLDSSKYTKGLTPEDKKLLAKRSAARKAALRSMVAV